MCEICDERAEQEERQANRLMALSAPPTPENVAGTEGYVRCPHCGECEAEPFMENGASRLVECPSCAEMYEVVCILVARYATWKQESF
jgi:hypothetical protein